MIGFDGTVIFDMGSSSELAHYNLYIDGRMAHSKEGLNSAIFFLSL